MYLVSKRLCGVMQGNELYPVTVYCESCVNTAGRAAQCYQQSERSRDLEKTNSCKRAIVTLFKESHARTCTVWRER